MGELSGIGSVCSGVGALDLAVERVFGEKTKWQVEYEKGPSKVLAHRFPDAHNYGDLTRIDWAGVPRVRVKCGGTPCQDLSGAGKRAGMTEGTRSNLWVSMREGIATLRPEYVVWENVRGAYSAGADSEVEREEGLLGGNGGRPLRALGRVLGDLSSLGYDTSWVGLPASAVGAPHGRYRVFVLAALPDAGRDESERRGDRRNLGGTPAAGHGEGDKWQWLRNAAGYRGPETLSDATGERWGEGWPESEGRSRGSAIEFGGTSTLPDADDTGRGEQRGPVAVRQEQLAAERFGDDATWGEYAGAVRRWEYITGQLAPAPVNPDGKGGINRLSAEFAEWLMGWARGWVTDPAIGLTRNEQLKAIGNGVVTLQAEFAIRYLWSVLRPQPHIAQTGER